MPQYPDLGEWIKVKWGDQGTLAARLKPSVAKNTVSSWKTGRNRIPPDYQKQLRGMGYDGPMPHEEAQEAPAPAGGPYATASEVAELRGALKAHIEQWERGQEKVLERILDVVRRIEQLEQGDD